MDFLDNAFMKHDLFTKTLHKDVSALKSGSWIKDGHIHQHTPDFFQHHMVGDFHNLNDFSDIKMPTFDIDPLKLKI